MSRPDEALEQGARAVLVTRHRGGPPRLQPVAYWFDGAALWMPLPADSDALGDLRDFGTCGVAVPAGRSGWGVIAHGRARVYALDDPVGLFLHGAAIAGAVAALALRNARTVVDAAPRSLLHVVRQPAVAAPVFVRVALDAVDALGHDAVDASGAVPTGVAPALPMSVPPDVRRALAGVRSVVLAVEGDTGVRLLAATWSAAFALSLPSAHQLAPQMPATVAVASLAGRDESAVLALSGSLADPLALRPTRAAWWHRGAHGSAAVTSVPAGSVVLPD